MHPARLHFEIRSFTESAPGRIIRKLRMITSINQCVVFLGVLIALAFNVPAASIPSPEKLLPDDTLVVVTVPDFPRIREIYRKSPQRQFWNDPAMKPFRDNFLSKWKDEFVKPLERELSVSFDSYTNLVRGQITFALIQNSGPGSD